MAKGGDSLFRRTTKSISVLFFETTKHSRIMKKRMRIGSLQKVLKADYRDLGILVYDALMAGRDPSFLAEGETRALVENISRRNHEIERLRESIARISRAKKHFDEGAAFEVHGLPSEPEGKGGRKRSFLGLKKRKAAEELARMAAKELSGPGPSPLDESPTIAGPETAPTKPPKAKRTFFGFKKKEKPAPAAEAAEAPAAAPAKAKAKRGFLGLGKKRETPPKKQSAKESPAPKKKGKAAKPGEEK